MKVFEVTMRVTAVVAANNALEAERWAVKNGAHIASQQTLEADDCSEVKSLADLEKVGDGSWHGCCVPYNGKLTLRELLPNDSGTVRCDKTADMFYPTPEHLAAAVVGEGKR